MKKTVLIFSFLGLISCKTYDTTSLIESQKPVQNEYYTIAFGSCDNQKIKNELWSAIDNNHPSVWIWGGDNVYSDTNTMGFLKSNYEIQKQDPDYLRFIEDKIILGTWDDHDYGANDGGEEYPFKRESQQLLLDFLGTSTNAPERKRDGVYTAKIIVVNGNKIKIFVLDSRFFRTSLTKAIHSKKRFQPNKYGEGTVLGTAQWKWLEKELTSSDAQFNVIVSSIQFLSDKHGFEAWGNFPHEIEKLEKLIVSTKAKGTFIISGDRHIATFSSKNVTGLSYPLVDFTSSGLTHIYTSFTSEENPYVKGKVVKELNFGLLKFDFKNNKVIMEIRGKENKFIQEYVQVYSEK
ncbi:MULTISPECIES: alkaline phosphatase D family protein [Flavobacterium]|uniref:Alkaline phosphatase family protein n=1 Tax=Flavobacterium ranwuense TaxID=2541725 RepID=A0ABY2DRD4_9FLAO|nr:MULTISPECIES: alkaline phosphatase D family protein [Flavobacterium]TDE27477.1 alkaline phosphatase family protein [Flavobacterium ranwuense]TDE49249.1 alkaline phosphatase family protein [Flavobacterium sp. GT3P67]